MADAHTSALRALVADNPGQATFDEYQLIDSVLRARAPCPLLVFGLGRDSEHWRVVNEGGRSVFLEHNPEWIRRGGDADVHRVRYWTHRCLWPLLRTRTPTLRMRLPESVEQKAWSVIFVDAPSGTRWYRPGRMQSVYTAAHLARKAIERHRGAEEGSGPGESEAPPTSPDRVVDVFVHDCDRPVEAECCDRFLGRERLVAQVGSMRHYRFS